MSSIQVIKGLTLLTLMISAVALPRDGWSQGFTFKRVKPPAAGTTNRINIQVDKTWPYETDDPVFPKSEGEVAIQEAPQDDAPSAPSELPAEWFWEQVSADLAAANPKRLDTALSALAENAALSADYEPHLPTIERIIKEHGPAILLATAGKRVSPAFVVAVMAVESGGKVQAVSPKGAQGLMQLIPATAKRFGVTDTSDPVQNISGGAAYLDWLMGEFSGDPLLSLAGYNAGENAVRRHNGVPPFAETRAYVPKVIATWAKARIYCQTLPRRVDDGCVFAFERSLTQ